MHERENKHRAAARVAAGMTSATTEPRVLRRTAAPLPKGAEQSERLVTMAQVEPGSPLPSELKTQFESSLGVDLSAVRIHTSPASSRAAESVDARAYALGTDIHFARGEYQPNSASGQRLLAHEVAHTAQAAGGHPAPRYTLRVSQPSDPAELEADRAAQAMLAHQSFKLSRSPTTLSREPKKGKEGHWADKTEMSGSAEGFSFKLFNFSTTMGPDKLSATFEHDLGEHKFPKDPLKTPELSSVPYPLAPGLNFVLKADAQAQASFGGSVSISANFNATERLIGVMVAGILKVGGAGTGRIRAMLAAGVPGVLSINAEGRLVGEIKLGGTLGVMGGFAYRPKGGGAGGGSIAGTIDGELTAGLDVVVSYDAPWLAGKGSKDLAKYRLAEWKILTLKGAGVMPFGPDVGTDLQPQVVGLKLEFHGPPGAALTDGLDHETQMKLRALSQKYDAALRAGNLMEMHRLHQAMKALHPDVFDAPIVLPEGAYFDEEGRLRNRNDEVSWDGLEVDDSIKLEVEEDGTVRVSGPPVEFQAAETPAATGGSEQVTLPDSAPADANAPAGELPDAETLQLSRSVATSGETVVQRQDNSYNRGELVWGGNDTALTEEEIRAWKNGKQKLIGAGQAYVELTTGWSLPDGDDVIEKLEEQAESEFDAEVESREQEIGWLESEVEYLEDEFGGWFEPDRDAYQEKMLQEYRVRLAKAEEDLDAYEDTRSDRMARVVQEAAGVVSAIGGVCSQISSAGQGLAAQTTALDPKAFSGLDEALEKIDMICTAISLGAQLADRTALNNFQSNPSFETAAAWGEKVGELLASAGSLAEGLPPGWGTVIGGMLKVPASLINSFTNTVRAYYERVDDEVQDRDHGKSKSLDEGTEG